MENVPLLTARSDGHVIVSMSTTGELTVHIPDEGIPLNEMVLEVIRSALVQYNGNVTLVARQLGMSRGSLRYRIGKLGLGRLVRRRRGRPMKRRKNFVPHK